MTTPLLFVGKKCVYCFLFLLLNCISVQSLNPDKTITIQLNKTTTLLNTEVYSGFLNITRDSTLQFNFENVNKNVTFIIFQVHSHIYNLTLSNGSMTYSSYVNGTNIGLFSPVKPTLPIFFILNSNDADVSLYVSVHGYKDLDPIPGGCNMEFPVPTSPFMEIEHRPDYFIVEGSPAKPFKDKGCDNNLSYEFYRLYLPERDFSPAAYFDGLRKMLTLDKILEYGDIIPSAGSFWTIRRMYSAYPGTGSVHVIVTYSTTGYSVYVPIHTYACPVGNDSCVLLDDSISRWTCAMLIFIGIFICYFGHRFFNTEMFVMGLAFGAVVTYLLISAISDLDRPGLVGASLLSGIFFGAIWLLFWWFYGIPISAVLLPTLNLGFLVACVVYHYIPGGIVIQENYNFYSIFICITIVTSLVLISCTYTANILCCTVLGAYAVLYPIDYYIGSNLKYLIINVIRRVSVPKFNKANLASPFQWNDAILTVTWVILSLTGFLFQHYHNRGKPPFPPPPRSVSPRLSVSVVISRTYGALTSNIPRFRTSIPHPGMANSNERTPLIA